MGFSGRLEGIAPSDIFQIISQNRMTGTLIARCQDGTAMVVFKDGQVIEATSDAPQESLGFLLVSQGLASEGTIAAAKEQRVRTPEKPLGAILVSMGAIDQKTLETVVLRQIERIVTRLMTCDDGFITFDRGETAVKRKLNTNEFFLDAGVSTEFLMMEGARVFDEEQARVKASDRRRSQPDVAADEGPEGERRRQTDEPPAAGAAPRQESVPSWFESISFPSYAAFAEAEVDLYRQGRKFLWTARDRVRSVVQPWFAGIRSKAAAFSPDGTAMLAAGIGAVAAAVVLIITLSFSSETTGGDLLITGKIVKLRAEPTTEADVVTKISQGEIVSPVEFRNDWHLVKTKAGETGWVWKSLVEQQEKKTIRIFKYRVTGSELLLFAGLGLLVEGFRRKQRTGANAAGPQGKA
ncbi:MAG: DUF4388 domain-containing protein [Nitrospirota bacterium]|nr:DUF4388 domain-containing protein [Nitrospirota bacterium]